LFAAKGCCRLFSAEIRLDKLFLFDKSPELLEVKRHDDQDQVVGQALNQLVEVHILHHLTNLLAAWHLT
jgi:hypothetical protein